MSNVSNPFPLDSDKFVSAREDFQEAQAARRLMASLKESFGESANCV